MILEEYLREVAAELSDRTAERAIA